MYQAQLKAGLKAFHKGGDIEKMIDIYKKNDWHIVETKEWKSFETQVHKLKGRFRYNHNCMEIYWNELTGRKIRKASVCHKGWSFYQCAHVIREIPTSDETKLNHSS